MDREYRVYDTGIIYWLLDDTRHRYPENSLLKKYLDTIITLHDILYDNMTAILMPYYPGASKVIPYYGGTAKAVYEGELEDLLKFIENTYFHYEDEVKYKAHTLRSSCNLYDFDKEITKYLNQGYHIDSDSTVNKITSSKIYKLDSELVRTVGMSTSYTVHRQVLNSDFYTNCNLKYTELPKETDNETTIS